MKSKIVKSDNRYRNWVFIVYDDSACADWRAVVSSWNVPAFISPLHDRDVNPDKTPKVPHYHVMLCFEGKKSIKQIKELIAPVCHVEPEIVSSVRGMARYLCHLDNPEKAQYSIKDVVSIAGADYQYTISCVSDKYKHLGDMTTFIRLNNVCSFARFFDYCKDYNEEWYRLLCDNCSSVISKYIKSFEHDQFIVNSTTTLPVDWWVGRVDNLESLKK